MALKTQKTPLAEFGGMASEEPIWTDLSVLIHGLIGSGKTSLAATISEFFPKEGWPTERHVGPPKYVLEDMAWLSFDRKATAGFKERGVDVWRFSVPQFMENEEQWKAAGLSKAPNIFQAATFALQVIQSRRPRYLVVDTVSSFDIELTSYGKKLGLPSQQMYGQVLDWHTDFSRECYKAAEAVIFLCHSVVPVNLDPGNQDAQARKDSLTTAAGGLITPQITGKGKLVYKKDNSLQLAVLTKAGKLGDKDSATRLERWVSPIKSAKHETKNRWELSLSAKEPAHLGQIFKKVAA